MLIEVSAFPEKAGTRIDRFLAEHLQLSRSRVKHLIDEHHLTVNNKAVKASYILTVTDHIQVELPPLKSLDLPAKDLHLDIIYEDSDMLVINKPVGMVVHPGAGTGDDTLVHGLLHHCQDLSGIGGIERPGILHRLDKDTSGVLVIAKHDRAHQNLALQFKERRITKLYLALIEGRLNQPGGTINYPIGRQPNDRKKMTVFKTTAEATTHHARHAITEYRVLAEKDNKTLLEVQILTGRTHQIRVHLAAIGHPVVGDPIYGKSHGKRQLLHAYKIRIKHPTREIEMEFTAPPPSWTHGFIKS